MRRVMGFRGGWACLWAVLALGISGCTLPRSGPTAGEITAAANAETPGLNIVTVTPAVAAATRIDESLALSSAFVVAGTLAPDSISPGDTLSVTVWENVEAGLLAGSGERVTAVEQIQVDQSGDMFLPYVGRISATGRSPEDLRQEITSSLSDQTPDPQVEVRRVAGDGATVTLLGGVGAPGIYPIDAPALRLSSMLARAGGVDVIPDVAQVKIERGGRTGRLWLQDLYDDPRLDIALRDGDRVIVEEDRRTFTALGASTRQSRVPFSKRSMSALEAIATAGGLDGRAADPTGVFVFRAETSEIANAVLGRGDLVGPQRMAYVLDLTEPAGLFSAADFVIRDEDTIYITEAPFASWSRVLGIATSAVSLTGSVAAISQ